MSHCSKLNIILTPQKLDPLSLGGREAPRAKLVVLMLLLHSNTHESKNGRNFEVLVIFIRPEVSPDKNLGILMAEPASR